MRYPFTWDFSGARTSRVSSREDRFTKRRILYGISELMYVIEEEENRYFPALRSLLSEPTSNAHRAPPKVSRPPLFPVRYVARSRPISHFIIRVLPWANRWPRLRGLIYLNCFSNFHSPPPPSRWWCALDTIMDPPSGGPRSLTRIQYFALPLIDAAGRGCSIIRRRFVERQARKPLPFKSSLSLTGNCKFVRFNCAFRASSVFSPESRMRNHQQVLRWYFAPSM